MSLKLVEICGLFAIGFACGWFLYKRPWWVFVGYALLAGAAWTLFIAGIRLGSCEVACEIDGALRRVLHHRRLLQDAAVRLPPLGLHDGRGSGGQRVVVGVLDKHGKLGPKRGKTK